MFSYQMWVVEDPVCQPECVSGGNEAACARSLVCAPGPGSHMLLCPNSKCSDLSRQGCLIRELLQQVGRFIGSADVFSHLDEGQQGDRGSTWTLRANPDGI